MVVAVNRLDAGGTWRGLERMGKRIEFWRETKAQKPQPVAPSSDEPEEPTSEAT